MFNYFYGGEAEQYTFYRVPKVLFTDPIFKALSCEAKVLYGLMLDRMSLSLKNRWLDDENRVYIYFTIESVMEYMNCCKQKAIKIMQELDSKKGIGLIEKIRQGLNKPDLIYVKDYSTPLKYRKCENHTSRSNEIIPQEVTESYPNKNDFNKHYKNKHENNNTSHQNIEEIKENEEKTFVVVQNTNINDFEKRQKKDPSFSEKEKPNENIILHNNMNAETQLIIKELVYKNFNINLSKSQVEQIINKSNNDIEYIKEKIDLTKKSNCENIIGFFISALERDFIVKRNKQRKGLNNFSDQRDWDFEMIERKTMEEINREVEKLELAEKLA